jgi:hypothetical protein
VYYKPLIKWREIGMWKSTIDSKEKLKAAEIKKQLINKQKEDFKLRAVKYRNKYKANFTFGILESKSEEGWIRFYLETLPDFVIDKIYRAHNCAAKSPIFITDEKRQYLFDNHKDLRIDEKYLINKFPKEISRTLNGPRKSIRRMKKMPCKISGKKIINGIEV